MVVKDDSVCVNVACCGHRRGIKILRGVVANGRRVFQAWFRTNSLRGCGGRVAQWRARASLVSEAREKRNRHQLMSRRCNGGDLHIISWLKHGTAVRYPPQRDACLPSMILTWFDVMKRRCCGQAAKASWEEEEAGHGMKRRKWRRVLLPAGIGLTRIRRKQNKRQNKWQRRRAGVRTSRALINMEVVGHGGIMASGGGECQRKSVIGIGSIARQRHGVVSS